MPLVQEEPLLEWSAKQGIDRKRFADMMSSFAVQSQLSQANQSVKVYDIDAVPSVVIGGKYLTRRASHGRSFAGDDVVQSGATALDICQRRIHPISHDAGLGATTVSVPPLSYCADLVRVGFGGEPYFSFAVDLMALPGFTALFIVVAHYFHRKTRDRVI